MVGVLNCEEILRDEAGHGSVVLVRVVVPVGVELDLAAVEVKDRRVRPLAIGLGKVPSSFNSTERRGLPLDFSILYPLDPEFYLAAS
jgi:hypothetical protein